MGKDKHFTHSSGSSAAIRVPVADSSLSHKDNLLTLEKLTGKRKKIGGDDYSFPGPSEYIESIYKL